MMRKSLFTLRALALALGLAFAAQPSASAQAAGEITITGRLTPTVEAGGWIVATERGGYLILNADQFRRESWFREGASVEATGRVKDDAVSIHMQGIPFQARTMRPRGGGAQQSAGGQAAAAGGAARASTRVIVSGDSIVQAQPDTAVLTLAVVTQNASASEAQEENASRTEAVVRAVRAAAGAGAEVKTSGYSLQPQYAYKEGAPPTITSYIVRNAVTVTTGELARVGPVIDAASRAGANSVDGVAFMLRRDEQARRQALGDATREALTKARAIAETLGGRLLRVVEVQESGTTRPRPVYEREGPVNGRIALAAQSAQTPVEPGSLEIHAQVQIVAEIETSE